VTRHGSSRRHGASRRPERRRTERRRGSTGSSPAPRRSVLAKLVRGLGTSADPIQAEYLASMLVAPFRSAHPIERDEAADAGVEMIGEIAAQPTADWLALLRAVATLDPPPMADAARSVISRQAV
jgi:hypothetical protein